MIGPFFTSLRCPKVLKQKGSQGPKNEDFSRVTQIFRAKGSHGSKNEEFEKKAKNKEKRKETLIAGIHPIYNCAKFNMIALFKVLTQNCNKQTQKWTKARCLSNYTFPF